MNRNIKKYTFIFILLNFSILAISVFYNFLFEEKLLSVFSDGCAFKNLFGFYCPGCGGSRSLNALLSLRLWRSFLYYPAIPYTAFLVLVIDIRLLFSIIKKKDFLSSFRYNLFIGVPIIIMLNFFIKNAFLLVGTDILEII